MVPTRHYVDPRCEWKEKEDDDESVVEVSFLLLYYRFVRGAIHITFTHIVCSSPSRVISH